MRTLKDRLSHLSFTQACKLLGPQGKALIMEGGKFDISLQDHVTLTEDHFRLILGKVRVDLSLNAAKRKRMNLQCSACNGHCEHQGAALSLILEEKLALGLSAPPPQRKPMERLSEEALVKQAVAERQQRAIEDPKDLLRRIRQVERLGALVNLYPDAEAYLEKKLFQARMAAVANDIRKDPAAHPLRNALLKAELRPYQLDGIAFAAGAGRAVLADDMGLGKTIQGIGVAELLARHASVSRVLVICPASLKSQWRIEIDKFCRRSCRLVLGSAKERPAQYTDDQFFTICKYEQVLRDLLAIERVRWDLIILDEGKRIKNWEAKTSRVIKALASPFALVLSGTPLENRLDELYSVVEFIDDRRLGPAFRLSRPSSTKNTCRRWTCSVCKRPC